MGVVCPACGHSSQDVEKCDRCRADLRDTQVHGQAPAAPPPRRCPVSDAGVELTPAQQAILGRPEDFLLIQTTAGWRRVHWLGADALTERGALLRKRLDESPLRCLPPGRLVEDAGGAWLIMEVASKPAASGGGPPSFAPWRFPRPDPLHELERLLAFLPRLVDALEELHSQGLVWLTFNPEYLEEADAGQLRFTNLDLGVYPHGQCPEHLALVPSFAAPEIVRLQPEEIGPRTDVFHLALFCYYWLARLLPHGFAGEGLESFWYQVPKLRVFAPQVPPGISGVVARGLAVDPSERYATPRAFAAALQGAAEHARKRHDFQAPVRWQLGAHTRTGRTKAALGRGNEDHILLHSFPKPERALLAVADGITTCDVGSGALASLITTIVLESTFTAESTRATFTAKIAEVCRQCAETLLDWALQKGYLPQLEQGADLMGTTLTAAWLEGNTLSLANIGDSRAYLVDKTGAEQLTVDGDLASGMLAGGTPPESIRALGPVGKALRECIGGCAFTTGGQITILEESCVPNLTDWTLLPGDVLVLCSDGLVEEEAFMEPETMAEIVNNHRHLSAEELAVLLVEMADRMHRLPSAQEPEGFGDNISCVVIKVEK